MNSSRVIRCRYTLRFGELVQQQLGFGRQRVRAVRISIVQCLLGLLQESSYLRGGDFLFRREGPFDPAQSLLRFADQIRCLVLGSFSQGAVTGGQLTNGRAVRRTSCWLFAGQWPAQRPGTGRLLRVEQHPPGGRGRLRRVCRLGWGRLGLACTFLGGGGGGSGTLCADGGGNGEASGVSVFSCCCVVWAGSTSLCLSAVAEPAPAAAETRFCANTQYRRWRAAPTTSIGWLPSSPGLLGYDSSS